MDTKYNNVDKDNKKKLLEIENKLKNLSPVETKTTESKTNTSNSPEKDLQKKFNDIDNKINDLDKDHKKKLSDI